MPIVSNTSPVLNLAIVGRLPLLRQQFGEIWIPPLQRAMQDLREKAGFHIGAELFAELLRESGE